MYQFIKYIRCRYDRHFLPHQSSLLNRVFKDVGIGILLLIFSVGNPLYEASAFGQSPPIEDSDSLPPPENTSESSENFPSEPSELTLFEDIPVVVTASKKPERITQAPSIISVITEDDIERMGAQTIMDVLRIIPGMEIMRDEYNISQIAVRGLRSETSAGVKILIDGHALNDPITGGATKFYDDIPLRNVRRIEIIRGPASALYGANAFVSAVNIITKNVWEINGVEVALGVGSFQTFNPSILFGKALGNLEIILYADYYKTDGAELSLGVDAATLYDEFDLPEGFAPVSLAPGTFQEERERINLAYKIHFLDFSLYGQFWEKHRGPFLTDWFVLNEDSSEDTRHIYTALEYQRFLTERIEFTGNIYADYVHLETHEQAAPGILFSNVDDDEYFIYPEGLISTTHATGWRLGSEDHIKIRLFEHNDLTIGVAYEYFSVEDATFRTNVFNAERGTPPNELEDLRNIFPEVDSSSYQTFAAIFAQDTWQIRRNFDLTLGIRADYFSEFGAVFTPKIGMTYEPAANLNLKLLFGSAFRIPSFSEELITVTAQDDESAEDVINSGLAAEELNTFEIGIGYKPLEWLVGEINYFYTDITKIAESTDEEDAELYPLGTTQTYRSVGGIDVQGVEIELRGRSKKEIALGIIPRIISSTFHLNYSYQDTQDSTTHEKVPNMARHKGNIGIGLNLSAEERQNNGLDMSGIFRTFSDEFSLYFNLFLCGKRQRSPQDTRDALPGFGVLDMTLTAYDVFHKGLDLSFSLKNMLAEQYHDPSSEEFTEEDLSLVSDDLPNPGRSFFVELRYTF